jgi:hypothetical protein
MDGLRLSGRALRVCVATALLAGCGGPQGQFTTLAAVPRGVGVDSVAPQGSWIAPESANQALLYVADYASNKVEIYTYPEAQHVGTLSGFDGPWGACSDTHGNVWITNFVRHDVVEYAHAGTKPVETIDDGSGYPLACAVDPTTGNLAIANVYKDGNVSGDVLVVDVKSKTPKAYASPFIYYYYSVGYDTKGDLYIDGTSRAKLFHLSELAKGAPSLKGIALNKKIPYPVGLQWLGTYLDIGSTINASSGASYLVRVKIENQVATILGETKLSGPIGSWIVVDAGKVVASQRSDVVYFGYPKGGSPKKRIKGFEYPLGVAISVPQ